MNALRPLPPVMVCALSATLHAQAPSTLAPNTAIAPHIATFLNQWQVAWMQSEGSRHPIVNSFDGVHWLRIKGKNGSVRFRPNKGTPGPDTAVFHSQQPVRRVSTVVCNPTALDHLKNRGIARDGDFPTVAHGLGWSVPSQVTGFAVCPTWFLGPESLPPWDERKGIDQALTPDRRTSIRRARTSLIAKLDSAVSADPRDGWTTGQLVRMLVDQGNLPDARAALGKCDTTEWWCSMLRGYVASSNNELEAAESEFRRALAGMHIDQRCAKSDIAPLLDAEFRSAYARLGCAERDSVNAIFWWLADPLWIQRGNDRGAEHFTRRTLLDLRRALSHDERFDWRHERGADARDEMVMRYGWPAFTYWRGFFQDSVITQYLQDSAGSPNRLGRRPATDGKASPPNAPYVSYEYPAGRVHVAPSARALFSPFSAAASEWSLVSPSGGDTLIHFDVPHSYRRTNMSSENMERHIQNARVFGRWEAEQYPAFVRNTLWWPSEHYAAAVPLRQLPDPEVVFLRRHDHVLVGTSLLLDASAQRTNGSNVDSVSLVITPHPDTINIAASRTGIAGTAATIYAPIPATAAMLGIEVPARSEVPAARTRFGIRPPAALREMKEAEQAISQPVLLTVPATAGIPTSASEALEVLAPSGDIERGNAFAVYWETYGFKASDSVTIAVRLQRGTRQGAMRQLAIALNLVPDQNTPVAISWRESGAFTGTRMVIDGPVPIIGRSLRIATAELPPGEYTLEIGVQRAGGDPVRSEKSIRIR